MKYATVLAMTLCALFSRAVGQPYFPYKTIAATGQNAPQTESGTIYQQIGTPTINAHGEVAFSAWLSGPRVTNNYQGVWISGASGVRILSRANDLAPGTIRRFSSFDDVWMLNGQAAFKAEFSDLSPGYWSGAPGGLKLIAAVGQAAPGMAAGVSFSELDEHIFTADQIAFAGLVSGNGIDSAHAAGIWAGPLDAPAPVVRGGDHAPEVDGDVALKNLYLSSFNGTGGLLFSSEMSGDGLTNLNDGALFAGRPGNFRLIARERGPAPETSDDTVLLELFNPAMTDKGAVAYQAVFNGPGVDASNVTGLYAGVAGQMHLIARRGWQAPGMPAGVTYHSPGAPAFDRSTGYFAFASTLDTPEADPAHHSALYVGAAESFELRAYTGMAVPGVENAVFSSFGPLVLNANGQMAFVAYIMGTGIDAGRNNQGIWATDLNGDLHLVARTGVPFVISPTDSAIPTLLSIASNDVYDVGQFAFNDNGQLVFHTEFFGSREGVFLVSTLPAPSCFLLLAALSLWSLQKARRPPQE